MKFLVETAFLVAGLVIFFACAFLAPSLFWIGFIVLLVFAAIAFFLGYVRRQRSPEQTLKEEIEQL